MFGSDSDVSGAETCVGDTLVICSLMDFMGRIFCV